MSSRLKNDTEVAPRHKTAKIIIIIGIKMKVTNHPNLGCGEVAYSSISMANTSPDNTLVTLSALVGDDSSCSLSLNFLSIDESTMSITSSFTINDYLLAESLSEAVTQFVLSYQKYKVLGLVKVSDALYVCDTHGNENADVSVHEVVTDRVSGTNKITPEFLFSQQGKGHIIGDYTPSFVSVPRQRK